MYSEDGEKNQGNIWLVVASFVIMKISTQTHEFYIIIYTGCINSSWSFKAYPSWYLDDIYNLLIGSETKK